MILMWKSKAMRNFIFFKGTNIWCFFSPFFSHNKLSFLFYFQTSRPGPWRLLFTISDYSIKGVNKWTNCHMIITIRDKNNHGLRLSWPPLGRRKAAPPGIARWSYTREDAYLPSNEEQKKKILFFWVSSKVSVRWHVTAAHTQWWSGFWKVRLGCRFTV